MDKLNGSLTVFILSDIFLGKVRRANKQTNNAHKFSLLSKHCETPATMQTECNFAINLFLLSNSIVCLASCYRLYEIMPWCFIHVCRELADSSVKFVFKCDNCYDTSQKTFITLSSSWSCSCLQ